MKRLEIEAAVENLDKVISFTDECLESYGCSMKIQMQLELTVEEIFVNIASYAYAPGKGSAVITSDFDSDTDTFSMVFEDSGIQYNPLAKEDPDVTLPASQRSIGGLGIFLVKKNMDNVEYEYKDGKNILTIYKIISD